MIICASTLIQLIAVQNSVLSAESYLKYAHGIVSEYLADDLSAKLSKHLGLPTDNEVNSNKRKQLASANINNSDNKRPKYDSNAPSLEEPIKNGALDLSKPEKVSCSFRCILYLYICVLYSCTGYEELMLLCRTVVFLSLCNLNFC